MSWNKYSIGKDGFVWICYTSGCSEYKKTVSIRHGTVFYNSKLSLQCFIQVIYYWCTDFLEVQASNVLKISTRTIQELYGAFRLACKTYFDENPIILGGPGVIIQIDESCFSHKVKFHRGRGPKAPMWVFGLVDCSTTPAMGYMEVVERRDAATIMPIIERVVRSGSMIHSDQWKAYGKIASKECYGHKTVNHKLHFVDPETGVHTQTIESYWNKHKHTIKKMNGCQRDSLASYLDEFMWKERNRGQKFMNFLELLKHK